jgi:hypothetical protein
VNVKKIEIVINHQLIKIIYLKQDLNWLKQRYWVTVDGLTNTIRVIDMRCLDIRAEP